MKRLIALGLLISFPAGAEPWIDYEFLLRQQTDKAVTSTDAQGRLVRSIDFDDGLTVVCTGPVGEADCVGKDDSENGLAGCYFALADALNQFVHSCQGLASEDEKKSIEALYDLLGKYVAENAVPKLSWGELRHRLETSAEPIPAKECVRPAQSEMDQGIREFVSPKVIDIVKRQIAVPRLPVAYRCYG